MRIGAHNLLAVEFENESQDAVSGWMLRAKVDGVMPDLALIGVRGGFVSLTQ